VRVLCFFAFALAACTLRAAVWPDYLGITMPPNIAPLNFRAPGATAAEFRAQDGSRLSADVDGAGVVRWPLRAWRAFLQAHAGEDVTLCLAGEGACVATNHIARAPIDSHLTYRLIPPSYRYFNEIGIYQRDLTSFAERVLYRNVQVTSSQCVNCHTYNRADPETYLFHTRLAVAGTHIVSPRWGRRKVDLKRGDMFASGTYPAWHPSGDFIAFSVNKTRQQFYETHPDIIEVFDLRSDLVLYSLADDRVLPVETEPEIFETYPTWSPDGRDLYTARARIRSIAKEADRAREKDLTCHMFYDLVVRRFDAAGMTFSAPVMLIDAVKSSQSVSLPRVSPDGRWLVLVVAPYGTFHIWHRESDLWMLDLVRHELRALDELNSADSESYHCFSRNGSWMVFSSRREDGAYTRPYFAHFDATTGRFSKPFLLPVENPRDHERRMFSYNVPEFSTGPVCATPRELRQLVEQVPRSGPK